MSILIVLMIILAALVMLFLMVSLFVRKEYHVEREIIVDRPKEEVFGYLRYLRNQDHYGVWTMADPGAKKTFRGTDGLPGFVYAWDGNKKVGQGEQEIRRIREGELIDIEVRFRKPYEGIAYTPVTTEAMGPVSTLVKWEIRGRNPYPFNLVHVFLEKSVRRNIDKSLLNLKKILETSGGQYDS